MLATACSSSGALRPREAAATDYVVGATYALQHDRFLELQGWPPGLAPPEIVAESVAYGDAGPASADQFRDTPARWPRIVGVLPAGTTLRFEALVRHRYPLLEDWYQATATVLDGEFRGREVELLRISRSDPGSRVLRVDTDELRPVTPVH